MTTGTKYYASGRRSSKFSLDVSPRIADHSPITERSQQTLNKNANQGEPQSTVVVVIDAENLQNLIPSTSVVADLNVLGTGRALAVDIYHSPAYYNCYPPPIFIPSISLMQIAVFCYDAYVSGSTPIDSPLIYNPDRRYEIWRYLSAMFIHLGWFHLTVNIFAQLGFGIPLEMVHKFWRLAIIYLLGVLAGSLATSLTNPNSFGAGASGGICALIGAQLMDFALNWAAMGRPFRFLMVLLSALGIDVILSVIYGLISAAKVGHSAHFFGAVAGALAGGVVLRSLVELKWERKARWLCLAALVSLFTALIVWNLVSSH